MQVTSPIASIYLCRARHSIQFGYLPLLNAIVLLISLRVVMFQALSQEIENAVFERKLMLQPEQDIENTYY